MNAVLKTEVIEYWSCDIPEHRHKTEDIANKCILSHTLKRGKEYYDKIRLRNLSIFDDYNNGMRKCDIARKYERSPTRIGNIIARFERHIRNTNIS